MYPAILAAGASKNLFENKQDMCVGSLGSPAAHVHLSFPPQLAVRPRKNTFIDSGGAGPGPGRQPSGASCCPRVTCMVKSYTNAFC